MTSDEAMQRHLISDFIDDDSLSHIPTAIVSNNTDPIQRLAAGVPSGTLSVPNVTLSRVPTAVISNDTDSIQRLAAGVPNGTLNVPNITLSCVPTAIVSNNTDLIRLDAGVHNDTLSVPNVTLICVPTPSVPNNTDPIQRLAAGVPNGTLNVPNVTLSRVPTAIVSNNTDPIQRLAATVPNDTLNAGVPNATVIVPIVTAAGPQVICDSVQSSTTAQQTVPSSSKITTASVAVDGRLSCMLVNIYHKQMNFPEPFFQSMCKPASCRHRLLPPSQHFCNF